MYLLSLGLQLSYIAINMPYLHLVKETTLEVSSFNVIDIPLLSGHA